MAEIEITPNTEANPNGATLTIPQNNEGATQIKTVDTQTTEPKKVEAHAYSQEQFDNAMAKTRGTTERETRRKILAELGLKDDEMDKLSAFKEAYQNSLSDEEKRNQIMEDLQAENLTLTQSVEDKDYVIKALVKLTGKKEEDVEKIVKMAKGLRTEDNSIEDAIDEVVSMIHVDNKPAQTIDINSNMPTSQNIQQPSDKLIVNTSENPFKAGQINLTRQGELLRTDPELAKRLKAEAGYIN